MSEKDHMQSSETRRRIEDGSEPESKLRSRDCKCLSSGYVLLCSNKPDSTRPDDFEREEQKARFVAVVDLPIL